MELNLPKGVTLTPMPEKTLSGMIASGELDCVMIARPPRSFLDKHPDVVRLFPDFEAMEHRYYEDTRVYPIMHIIALRKEILAVNDQETEGADKPCISLSCPVVGLPNGTQPGQSQSKGSGWTSLMRMAWRPAVGSVAWSGDRATAA